LRSSPNGVGLVDIQTLDPCGLEQGSIEQATLIRISRVKGASRQFLSIES
jgi:hypothetical protein